MSEHGIELMQLLHASEQRLTLTVGAILALCLVGVALVLFAPKQAHD